VARLPAEGYEASDADAGSTSTSNAGKSSKADSGATITESTDDDDDERTVVKARIRECARAAWGNLGAVYMVTVSGVWVWVWIGSRGADSDSRASTRRPWMRAPKVSYSLDSS